MMNIVSKLPTVGTTIFTVMSGLATEYNAINLSQGFPNYEIDPDLKALAQRYIQEGYNQYAPMTGVPALKEQISAKIQLLYNTECNLDTEITITNGATEAIYSAIAALVRAGDEVIIFEPAYDSYRPAIEVHGATPIPIRLRSPSYKIDWDEVQSKITARTKMIMINTPHNPTGSIWDESDIKALHEITKDTDIIILSDEVYQHLVYDGLEHQSVLRHPALKARSVVTMSFGKTFHATGWRIGYCIAPPKLSSEIRKVHQFNTFTINTPLQYALAEYLKKPSRYLSLGSYFQAKRDLFIDAIKDSRFEVIPCSGTYFVLARYNQINQMSDKEFARWMTIENGVAVIPISVFYSDGTDERIIRFCFAKQDETLLQAAEKIRKV